MSSDILHQKTLFRKQVFEIQDEGLKVIEKSITKSNEYFIAFENIGTKVVKLNQGRKGWLIAALVFLVLSVLLFVLQIRGAEAEKDGYLVYLALMVACLIVYISTFTRACLLVARDESAPISFLFNEPSRQILNDFIVNLKSERRKYLLEKYGKFSKLISYEQQFNTINWLSQTEVLSKEEHLQKMEELDALFTNTNIVTGFQNR